MRICVIFNYISTYQWPMGLRIGLSLKRVSSQSRLLCEVYRSWSQEENVGVTLTVIRLPSLIVHQSACLPQCLPSPPLCVSTLLWPSIRYSLNFVLPASCLDCFLSCGIVVSYRCTGQSRTCSTTLWSSTAECRSWRLSPTSSWRRPSTTSRSTPHPSGRKTPSSSR